MQPANSQAPTAPTHTHKHLLCIIFHTITWTTEIFWCVSQCIIICTIPSITMRSPNSKDWPWPAHNLFIWLKRAFLPASLLLSSSLLAGLRETGSKRIKSFKTWNSCNYWHANFKALSALPVQFHKDFSNSHGCHYRYDVGHAALLAAQCKHLSIAWCNRKCCHGTSQRSYRTW